MKTPYEQRHELGFNAIHFGKASNRARIAYGVVLTLFMLLTLMMQIWASPAKPSLASVPNQDCMTLSTTSSDSANASAPLSFDLFDY